MIVSKSGLLPKLLSMDKNTVGAALNSKKKVSDDCKQLKKIEKFVNRHFSEDFANLQSEIDDCKPPSADPCDGPPPKLSRCNFNDAAKMFFKASLAAWRETSGAERTAFEKSLLEAAKTEPSATNFNSAAWSQGTVHGAMDNLNKRSNSSARAQDEATCGT